MKSKKKKIYFCAIIALYIVAFVIFHVTYDYHIYWVDEEIIVIWSTVIYILLALLPLLIGNRLQIVNSVRSVRNAKVTIKGATLIAALAGLVNGICCFLPFVVEDFGNILEGLIYPLGWMAVSAFFFTLYKNMK